MIFQYFFKADLISKDFLRKPSKFKYFFKPVLRMAVTTAVRTLWFILSTSSQSYLATQGGGGVL